MDYATIPGLDRPVSRLILGTMAYAPEPPDRLEHWCAMLDAFLGLGGNALDTAHVYGGGRSERTLAAWLQRRDNREQVLIVDKGAHPSRDETHRVRPDAIDADVRESLERLQTPYIDLYLLHRDDRDEPVGSIVDCLNEHIAAGRLRAIGCSNWRHDRIEEANAYAAAHGLHGFVASRPNLSLAAAQEPLWPGCVSVDEQELAWYRAQRFPLLSWSSQARGFFSGRFQPDQPDNADMVRVYYDDANWERLRRARLLAERHDCSPTRIALAWVLAQPLPTFPLIGPLTLDELHDSVAALEIRLGPEETAWLNLERDALPA